MYSYVTAYVSTCGKQNSLLEKTLTSASEQRSQCKTGKKQPHTKKTYHKKTPQFWNRYGVECKVPQTLM